MGTRILRLWDHQSPFEQQCCMPNFLGEISLPAKMTWWAVLGICRDELYNPYGNERKYKSGMPKEWDICTTIIFWSRLHISPKHQVYSELNFYKLFVFQGSIWTYGFFFKASTYDGNDHKKWMFHEINLMIILFLNSFKYCFCWKNGVQNTKEPEFNYFP